MSPRLTLVLGALLAAALVPASAQAAPERLLYCQYATGSSFPNVIPLTGSSTSGCGLTAGYPAVDYVPYAPTFAYGRDWDHTTSAPSYLKGDFWIDKAKVKTNGPAIVLMHGGIVADPAGLASGQSACTGSRRRAAYMTTLAQSLAARGYPVFTIDFRVAAPTSDVTKATNPFTGQPVAPPLDPNFPADYPGDCLPDAGWEPAAQAAQYSTQLAIRSFKTQLRSYNGGQLNSASNRIVTMGVSTGGHLAIRAAMRSEEGAAADVVGGTQASRRVSGAIGISTLGDCTASNTIRSFAPFATCGGATGVPVEAGDPPLRLFNAYRQIVQGFQVKAQRPPSGNYLGWDGVVEAQWPNAFCSDYAAAGNDCIFRRKGTLNQYPHKNYPASTGTGGSAEHAYELFGDESGSPTVGLIPGFLNSAAVPSITW